MKKNTILNPIIQNYDHSKFQWTEVGKYCVNARGELSIHIPTGAKTKEERIEMGECYVKRIKRIEFEE